MEDPHLTKLTPHLRRLSLAGIDAAREVWVVRLRDDFSAADMALGTTYRNHSV